MSTTSQTPPSAPPEDKDWEASLRTAVHRMSDDIRKQNEEAEEFRHRKPKRRRRIGFPIFIVLGLAVVAAQIAYLLSPMSPPPGEGALQGDKLAVANSVAEMIVVEEAVQAYMRENGGQIPESLHEIADRLPSHVRERVESGGLRLLRTDSKNYVISNDKTTAPAFVFNSGKLVVDKEAPAP